MSGINQIEETLKAQFDCDQPIYLLIDPIVGDLLPQLAFSDTDDAEVVRAAREEVFGHRVFPVVLAPEIHLSPSRHPYLVEIPRAEDPWMKVSLEIALEQNESQWATGMDGTGWGITKIGGWLQTAFSGEILAATLAGWMRLKTEVRTPARYLRLADSRVLTLLSFVLGYETLVASMAGLRRWSAIDAYGQLYSLHNPDADSESSALSLPRLDAKQWQIMQNGPVIHGAIAKAWGERRKSCASASAAYVNIPYASALAWIERFPEQSHFPGIPSISYASLEDRCTAIALALLYPEWEKQIEVQQHLAENAENYTLSDLGTELLQILERVAANENSTNANSQVQR